MLKPWRQAGSFALFLVNFIRYNLYEPEYNLHEPEYNLDETEYNLHEPEYKLHEHPIVQNPRNSEILHGLLTPFFLGLFIFLSR